MKWHDSDDPPRVAAKLQRFESDFGKRRYINPIIIKHEYNDSLLRQLALILKLKSEEKYDHNMFTKPNSIRRHG